MDRLEVIDGNNWKAFTEEPGVAVLMLAKTGCPACAAWTEELTEYLAADPQVLNGVRFGKMLLDRPGLADFKRNNLWARQRGGCGAVQRDLQRRPAAQELPRRRHGAAGDASEAARRLIPSSPSRHERRGRATISNRSELSLPIADQRTC